MQINAGKKIQRNQTKLQAKELIGKQILKQKYENIGKEVISEVWQLVAHQNEMSPSSWVVECPMYIGLGC